MKTQWIESECDFCCGEGYDDGEICENCNGTGVIKELNVTKQQEK
jgi:DnaJ-class molecular chaperone